MRVAERNLELAGLDRPLRARLTAPPDPSRAVVLAHGFKGFMDWGCWPWVAARLAEAGVACLRFNFSHNGIGADPEAFTELDRFEANTFSREVAELRAVLEAARDLPELRGLEVSPLDHGRRLEAAGARLVVIPGGDHTFGAAHPFRGEAPAPLRAALAATLEALQS